MKPYLIGFGHKRHMGKDEAIKAIIQAYGGLYDIRRYHPADYMKRKVCGHEKELCEQYGVPYDENPDRSDPLCNSIHGKQGALLQYLAKAERIEDPFKPARILQQQIAEEKPEFALISGVRFVNEVGWIRTNGIYVKVVRLGYNPPHVDNRKDDDPSETALDGVEPDALIEAGTLQTLHADAIELFGSVLDRLSFTTDTYKEFLV